MENSYSLHETIKDFQDFKGERNLKRSMRIPLGNLQTEQGKSLQNIKVLIVILL